MSSAAVLGLSTRWRCGGAAGTNRPSADVVPATMVGCTRTPPFAMVA